MTTVHDPNLPLNWNLERTSVECTDSSYSCTLGVVTVKKIKNDSNEDLLAQD